MPRKIAAACRKPGCHHLQASGSSYCVKHAIPRVRTDTDRARDKQRATAAERGYGSSWRVTRRRVILRDGKRCQVCGADGYLVVHHIDHDPLHNDMSNLTTMCR